MLQDLRYGFRILLRSKGWTAVVVVSLALAIGPNTVLFSAVNGLLMRKLPVEDPDSLVRLRYVGRNDMVTSSSDYGIVSREDGLPSRASFSYAMFEQLRQANRTMTDMFAGAPMFSSVNVVVDGQAEVATAYIASGNYHPLLGGRAALGRTIVPDDDRPGATPVAVISHGFWTRRFGRDPTVVGKVVRANDTPVTIVGVLPPEFTGVQAVIADAPDITFPLTLDAQLNAQVAGPPGTPPRLAQPTYWWLQIMGRLRSGVTAQQVQGNLDGVFQEAARQGMDLYLAALSAEERASSRNQDRTRVPRLSVSSGARGVYDNNPTELRTLTILSGVVGLILLIVCANVANLLLARAVARRRELTVRISLGASRMRLVRQLLTESVLLALLGGGLGLVVAYWGRQLLPGQVGQAPLDWRVLLFAWSLAMVTGMFFGILPALWATGRNARAALQENNRTVAGSRTRLGKTLLVAQVAISLVLLIGAGLFLRTVENLRRVDVGFDPRNVLVFRVDPLLNRYEPARVATLYEQMVDRLRVVPGVRAVTLSYPALLSGFVNNTSVAIQGRPFNQEADNVMYRVRIAPNFFDTMGMRILAGRAFMPRDDGQAAPTVAIINEAAVRKFFPRESPLGRRLGSTPETSDQIEIIGIVRDASYNSVRDAAPPTMYVPYTQYPVSGMWFEVRLAGEPAQAVGSIREAVRQVDATLPLMGVSTQIEQIEGRYAQERVFARAYALFGGLALLIASIGLFGLMSYSVTRRTNEIGIRMAVGAGRGDVLWMIMGESLALVLVGVAIGVASALAAGRFVASLLYGLRPTDAPTIALAVMVMVLVASLAGYLPARRASRVDPMTALRCE